MSYVPDLPGAAIASLVLNISILQKLNAKGILPLGEIADMVDRATLLVAEMTPDIPERQSVHEVLEEILLIVRRRQAPSQ